jgi:hypothetical protein
MASERRTDSFFNISSRMRFLLLAAKRHHENVESAFEHFVFGVLLHFYTVLSPKLKTSTASCVLLQMSQFEVH